MDILVELADGEIVIVEVQVNSEHDYFHRMLFGTSKIISEHMKAGQTYSNVKKVYSVNVLYFNLGQMTISIMVPPAMLVFIVKIILVKMKSKKRFIKKNMFIRFILSII